MLAAKSKIDTHGSKEHHEGTPRSKSIPTNFDAQKRFVVQKENEKMVERMVKANRYHKDVKSHTDLTNLSRNLKTYSSLGRSIKLKEIEREN